MRNGLEIDSYGNKLWFKEGGLHRLDGPAIEWNDGDKEWYKEGKRHRLDGPAIEYSNGGKYWYINGEKIEVSSNEEFLRYIKLKVFI